MKAANIHREHQDFAIRTDEDGRFKIPALPGKGIIAFSSDDWTAYPVGVGADEIDAPKLQDSSTLIFDTKPSSCVTRSFHALAAIDPQPDMSELTVDFSLVAGASVSGSVVDSKGNPIHDYYVRGQFDQSGWTKVKGETFEVKHYFVSERRRLMFFEPTRNLVGLYHLTGEPPETLRITLQPGGTIKGRIVDEAGLPIANLEFDNHQFAIKNEHYGDLLTWRDRKLLKTDQDGRFVFPGIIPGLKYSANVSGVKKVPGFTQPVMMRLGTAFTDITVEVGQTKDMGELTYNGKQEFVSKHRSIGKAKASSDGNSGPEQEPQSSAPKRKSDDDRMVVTGRVVDPDGKPISNAQIAVVGRRNSLFREPKPFGQTKTDVTGRYRLRMPRTSSSSFLKVSVFASSPGFGIGWQPLNLNADQPEVLIELPPEQIIRGRLINLEGQPASGVKVYVTQIGKPVPGGRTLWSMWFSEPVDDLSAWPGPITTDERGRFVLRGIGRKLAVNLQTRDEPFARESIHIRADDTTEIREISMALAPAQIIEGTVVSEKTGKPVPNARLNVTVGFDAKNKYAGSAISGRANENGYFRLNPYPGKSYVIAAFAPAGRAELNLQRELKWPVGSPQQRVEMRLPSGVLVRGRVTEAETGRPIAGAGIEYRPRRFGNSNLRDDVITGWQARTTSGKDGVFRIAVLPGPGHLLINGPTPDYIHQEVGARTIDGDQPGGQRIYAHAVHRLDLQLDAKVHTLDVSLRRGVTIKGRLVDPDGKPVKEAKMLWRYPMLASEHRFRGLPTTIRDGQFELHGLDPNETYPVVFLDPENELGAAVELSGRSDARRSLVVPMVPCGSATTRFIDPDGKPIAQYAPSLLIVITPGPGRVSLKEKDRSRLSADEGFVGNFDRRHYWNPPQTDEQGQCTFPALVPGAAYRFDVSRDGQLTVTKTFKVESGKTLQLPDVVTARE
jgi:protocatechuate 3,4-dioxygenase beta subunit